jgi:hypothetical protein
MVDTNWYGVFFLLALGLAVPIFRKISHARGLKKLGMEGVSISPRFWGLSGLRLQRAAWEGDVRFETSGMKGHLLLKAMLRRSLPSLSFHEKGKIDEARLGKVIFTTGDADFDGKIVVSGDPGFARKLLGSELRKRLMQLDQLGGRVWSVGGLSVEIAGPLLVRPAELRKFLEACGAVIEGIAALEA